MPITREPDDWELIDTSVDFWATRRPYLVSSGEVWIGEPGTHHDSAPSEMKRPDSSCGEIYDGQVRPYEHHDPQHAYDPKHKSLVEAAWRNHPGRPQD
jgi:hypothetical protein